MSCRWPRRGKTDRVLRAEILLLAVFFLLCTAAMSVPCVPRAYAMEEAGSEAHDDGENLQETDGTYTEDEDNNPQNDRDDGEKELPEENLYDVSVEQSTEDREDDLLLMQQPPTPRSSVSLQSAASETQELHRYTITAAGLPETGISAVEADITDSQGVVLQTLTLTAARNWTETWETVNPGEDYSVRFISVIGLNGEDITESWCCSTETTVGPRQQGYSGIVWQERSELTDGIYIFELQSQPGTLLAAGSKRTRGLGGYHYPLTAENGTPDQADGAAQWNVTARNESGYWSIGNMNMPGYLSICDQGSKNLCAAFEDDTVSIWFQNGTFCFPVNGTVNYLKFPVTTTTTTTSVGSASTFTAYQQTELTEYVTEHTAVLSFTENPVIRTAAVRVMLNIRGNIADRTERFPFTILLDGELLESFTLGDGEEYTVEEVPCGVRMTVQEDAGDYTAVSKAGEQTGNAILQIDEVPQNGVEAVFTNSLEGDIDTGIMTENGPWLLLLGISAAAGSLMVGKRVLKKDFGGN